ncbi:ABC transporter permease [Crateriforma spongiae]|uniref:ABC transporter permease n=1 Tax=Crateriforma spongiae TaxID=2724528 RepID=UPI0028F40E44|nr:ABC transporter permease [Crateriforma spongiae]
MNRPFMQIAQTVVAVGSVLVAMIAVWYAVVVMFDLPKILLPTPVDVVQAGWEERDAILRGMWVTGLTAVVGLFTAFLVGGGLSVLFSQSALLRRALFPYVVFLQTVPIVAIAPLLVIWSGYTFRSAVIATVIICLFPIVNNCTTGLLAVRTDHDELFSLYGAGRLRRMLRLQIPGAVPQIILGLRISSGLAVIGAIIAEFFVSNGSVYEGLGALMTGWQGRSRTDALIAALFASALLGLVLFGAVQLLAATVLRRWAYTGIYKSS